MLEEGCPMCGAAEEDVKHNMMLYSLGRQVWALSNLQWGLIQTIQGIRRAGLWGFFTGWMFRSSSFSCLFSGGCGNTAIKRHFKEERCRRIRFWQWQDVKSS
ncbi:UNVERIFIED_CONTAM: hypothetical protein Slati_0458100 [Sesamum latifolium]|uniref:Uncharacterized protein n=1 Tax=Sesamum latifolium TaxID=2727402 RepID=A0AAW2XYT2_9LAMI